MKRSLYRVLCLILVMLMIPLFSPTARAEDYSAVLNSLNFVITLMEDGSAFIVETREVVFSGDHEFSRYRVNNQFAGPREFWGWDVWVDDVIASQLDEPDNENRPENTFVVEDGDGENTVSIYFRQQGSGTRVFQISYWVENAIKLYSDVGVFSWNLTGENSISDIGTLTATLIVPDGVPDEDFRIWAHGPLNGSFKKKSEDSAFLQIDNIPMGTIVDIRCTLPADCFYGGWEQEGEALPGIMEEEKAFSDSANAKRAEAAQEQAAQEQPVQEQNTYWSERTAWEQNHPILYIIEQFCLSVCAIFSFFLFADGTTILAFLFAIPFIVIFVLFPISKKIGNNRHKRYQKELRNKPALSPQYYRDLPSDRPAPAVDRLVHYYDGKSSTSRQLSAALLELDLKKLIHFRTNAEEVTILLNEQLGEALFPASAPQETPEAAQEQIPEYQKLLWEFLLKAADGSGRIAMKDLKKYIRDNQEAAYKFRNSFESAAGKEFKEGFPLKDVEKYSSGGWKRRLIISAVAGLIVMLMNLIGSMYYGIVFAAAVMDGLIAFAVVLVLQAIFHFVRRIAESPCYVLEQQGEDELALWEAFGRFLDDFTTFDEKELPEFPVWRKYMVYAVAMGHGQKVAQALAVKYPETLSTGTDTVDDDMLRWLQDMALYDAMDSIGREVTEANAPSSSSSSSNDYSNDFDWSDASGGGGGFSDSGGGSDSGSGGDFID